MSARRRGSRQVTSPGHLIGEFAGLEGTNLAGQPLKLVGRGPGPFGGFSRTLCLDFLGRFSNRFSRVSQALASAIRETFILPSQVAQPLCLLDRLLLARHGIALRRGRRRVRGLAGAGPGLELLGECALFFRQLAQVVFHAGELAFLLVLGRPAEILLLLAIERAAGAGLLWIALAEQLSQGSAAH